MENTDIILKCKKQQNKWDFDNYLRSNIVMGVNAQATLALTGGVLTLIVLGSIYTFGALTPYISSYLYYEGDQTSNTAMSILFTMTLIVVGIGVTISNMVLSKLPNRVICVIAVLGLSATVFISSFMNTFVGYVIFYGLIYGFFIGIGYYPPVKNAYLHLPTRKGLCSGLCMSGFGFGSAIFNTVIMEFVNPNNINLDQHTRRYPYQVAENLPHALKILAGIYLGMGLLGAALVIPPKRLEQPKNETLLSQQSTISKEVEQNKKKSEEKANKQNLFKFFIRKKAYLVVAQVSCIAPFGMFMAFNYKRLAFDRNSYFLSNDHLVTLIGTVGILSNGLFRSVWGYIFDHISYKAIVVIINFCLLFSCAIALKAVQNAVTYFMLIPFIYVTYGGLYAITPTQCVRLLGHQVGSKLFWLIFCGFSISAIIQFIIQYFYLTYLGKDGYYWCFGTFFVLLLIGLAISITAHFQNQPEENVLFKKQSVQQQIDEVEP